LFESVDERLESRPNALKLRFIVRLYPNPLESLELLLILLDDKLESLSVVVVLLEAELAPESYRSIDFDTVPVRITGIFLT